MREEAPTCPSFPRCSPHALKTRAGLADRRYIAEPKLDGQRAQLHVRGHRTVHAFSRPGRELIRLPGLAWLREVRWPVATGILDGEAVARDGIEGIQAVLEARNTLGSPKRGTGGDPRQHMLSRAFSQLDVGTKLSGCAYWCAALLGLNSS